MCAGRNFDKFCKAISDLCGRQGPEEGEVQEGMNRRVIRPQPILVVAIIDRDFDGHRGVNQANDGSWDSDEVRVSAVRRASKPEAMQLVR
jgi:hypothetical protein